MELSFFLTRFIFSIEVGFYLFFFLSLIFFSQKRRHYGHTYAEKHMEPNVKGLLEHVQWCL